MEQLDYETTDDRQLLSVRETSAKTGISRRTLYKLIRDGEIPVIRFGTRIRLRWSDVVDDRLQIWGEG